MKRNEAGQLPERSPRTGKPYHYAASNCGPICAACASNDPQATTAYAQLVSYDMHGSECQDCGKLLEEARRQ